MNTVFAIADCNNFYASCERAFNPKLTNKPVIVLSNNDGCVVARSAEAKALGIGMGVPFWEIKALIQKENVQVFSSNYQLYGDMSERVMNILKNHCADIEIYSIDEAFMKFELSYINENQLIEYCQKIRSIVLQSTGIPISIGIATTKTLSKLANHLAKKQSKNGIFSLLDITQHETILSKISIDEVWGIGRAYHHHFQKKGIANVWELRNVSQTWVQKEFGVTLVRTIKELNGFSCLGLEAPILQRQNMVVSRSFSKDVYSKTELSEALSVYATRLGEKLRHYRQTTAVISIFLWSNRHKVIHPAGRVFFTRSIELPIASADTGTLIRAACNLLDDIYQEGINYKKAGIMATELQPENVTQGNLFESMASSDKKKSLMKTMDNINRRFGKNTLYIASCGLQQTWARREQWRSPRYTSDWGEILYIKI